MDTSKDERAPESDSTASQWWKKRGSRATAEAVSEVLSIIKPYSDRRLNLAIWHAKLYGNAASIGPFGLVFSQAQVATPGRNNSQVRINATKNCVDTIQSRVAARIRPRVWWLPRGATSYKTARTARKLNTFSDGLMIEQQVQRKACHAMRDAEIWGTGCIRVAMEPAKSEGKTRKSKLRYERVLESELRFDEQEALFGQPRQLHYLRALDRGTVAETWARDDAKLRGQILKENAVGAENTRARTATVSELIQVRESWRLADGPDSPGRHVITLSDCTLVDEEWPFNFFPIAFLRYSEPQVGFLGHGLVEALEPLQTQLNYVLIQIQNAQRVAGTFKMLCEMKSGISLDSMDGTLGPIISYVGQPPSWLTPPSVPAELYAERDRLLQLIHDEAGVSQMSTAGKSELGPNVSGAAIRTMLEVQQDRFASLSEIYNQFFVDINRISIELIKHAVESGEISNYEVQIIGPKKGQVVDWKALNLDLEMLHLQAWPVSSLPIEPEGRLAAIGERIQAGYMSPRTGKKLLDEPDVDAAEALENADEEWVETCISRMVDDGVSAMPSAEDNLQLFFDMTNKEVQLAKLGELDEDRINLLREARDESKRLMDSLAAAAAPPPVAGPAGAGMGPQIAPPVTPAPSPLVSQVPQQPQ